MLGEVGKNGVDKYNRKGSRKVGVAVYEKVGNSRGDKHEVGNRSRNVGASLLVFCE